MKKGLGIMLKTATAPDAEPNGHAAPRGAVPTKVAYLVSRFPKITETFVLYELLAVEQAGVRTELCALQRERTKVVHPGAETLLARARFVPFASWRCLAAQGHYLRRRPGAYLSALALLLRGTWGSLRYFCGALAFFPKAAYFARELERAGVQHLHAHFASHPAACALAVHRLTGIPYSFTAHGSDLHRDRRMLREKVADAAFVVAISDYNREIIVEECGEAARHKVAVIHCGVDTEVFQPSAEAQRRDKTATLHVLCIGTLHEVKGQTHLLAACRLLRESGIEVVCHLAGDGPDLAALKWQAEAEGLTDCVRFHGRQTREGIAALLRQADVLVAPSVVSSDGRREGIPVVLMEAMASGVPVVASRLSGIPELVRHDQTGLLVPPGDPAALARSLTRLVADPRLRRRLARAGRELVVREFDVHCNARELAARFGRGGTL
jgi:colanic acid/amylovoran biosynthesis glycosyltransferase